MGRWSCFDKQPRMMRGKRLHLRRLQEPMPGEEGDNGAAAHTFMFQQTTAGSSEAPKKHKLDKSECFKLPPFLNLN